MLSMLSFKSLKIIKRPIYTMFYFYNYIIGRQIFKTDFKHHRIRENSSEFEMHAFLHCFN